MTLTTSTITGRVPLPSDSAPKYAEVVFTLTKLDTEGDQVIPGGASSRFVLDANGDMPAGATLWRNTEGLRATAYRMVFNWDEFDRTRGTVRRTHDAGLVQVGDDASYTIAQLINATPVPVPVDTYWTSLTQAEYDAAIAAAASAATSAAEAAASAALSSTVNCGSISVLRTVDYTTLFAANVMSRVPLGISGGGSFRFVASDQSANITLATAAVASVDTGTNEISFAAHPNLLPRYPVIVTGAGAGLSVGEVYWISRELTDFRTIKLHPTFADAVAGTNVVPLTASGLPEIKVLRDALEAIYVIPNGLARDGSEGAWVRADHEGLYDPAWGCDAVGEEIDNHIGLFCALVYAQTSYGATRGCIVDGDGATYLTTVSLPECGTRRQPNQTIQNITLLGQGIAGAILDCTNSNNSKKRNVNLNTVAGYPCGIGFLLTRAHSEASISTPSVVFPTASGQLLEACSAIGEYTKAAYINVSADLTSTPNCKFENRYKSRNRRAVIQAGLMKSPNRLVGTITSDYHPIDDGTADNAKMGTTTMINMPMVEARAQAAYNLSILGVTVSAGVATVSVAPGSAIEENDALNIIIAPTQPMEIFSNNYTARNVDMVAGTFDLWNEGNSAPYDASGAVTPFNPALSNTVRANTGAAVSICGPVANVCLTGTYALGYAKALIEFDVVDGDILEPELDIVPENAQIFTIQVNKHATEARKLHGFIYSPETDFVLTGHINIGSGGALDMDDFKFLGGRQSGATSSVRLFSGTRSNTRLRNFDIVINKEVYLPILVGSGTDRTAGWLVAPTGKTFARDTGRTRHYPSGTYSAAITPVTNGLAASGTLQYRVEGEWCYVSGTLTTGGVQTSSGTASVGTINLPFNAADAGGSGVQGDINKVTGLYEIGRIRGGSATTATAHITCVGVSGLVFDVAFAYKIA